MGARAISRALPVYHWRRHTTPAERVSPSEDMWRATYPFSGALYVFRAKRADRIKIVWFDGTGVCLFTNDLRSYYTSSSFS
jgi:hypothetical protein